MKLTHNLEVFSTLDVKNQLSKLKIKFINRKKIALILAFTLSLNNSFIYAKEKSDAKEALNSTELITTNLSGAITLGNGHKLESELKVESIPMRIVGTQLIPDRIEDRVTLERKLEFYQNNIGQQQSGTFELGSRIDIENFLNKMTGKLGQEIIAASETYLGGDPYLLAALLANESNLDHQNHLPGTAYYNGSAVGIGQIENPCLNPTENDIIYGYNFVTNETDSIYRSMSNAIDEKTNLKMSAIIFRAGIENANGNIPLALYYYNFGTPMANKAVTLYAEETGQTVDQVKENYSDLGWMKYIKDIHCNPHKYLSNWKNKTYGNAEYANQVMKNFLGNYTYIIYNGNKIYWNLETMETTIVPIEKEQEKQFALS